MLVTINTRRYDLMENPNVLPIDVELHEMMDYNSIKNVIKNQLGITDNDSCILKVRNSKGTILPLSYLIQEPSTNGSLFLDITKVHRSVPTTKRNAHLQDAYLDAIKRKIYTMEKKIIHAEQLVPQLQWKRQTHADQTVQNLVARMAFLNRRVDDLMPTEGNNSMQLQSV